MTYFIEVWDFGDIHYAGTLGPVCSRWEIRLTEVNHREVLHLCLDLVQGFVHLHALWVPVVSEANTDDTVFFHHDCLSGEGQQGKGGTGKGRWGGEVPGLRAILMGDWRTVST